MAIKLKNDDTNEAQETLDQKPDSFSDFEDEQESKFRGGIGDGTVDIDKINDLPAYTAPPVINSGRSGAVSGAQRRSIIYKIIGIILVAVLCFFVYKGVSYMTGSGGKDITDELTKSEDEISKDLKITFEDNPARVKSISHFCAGEITVRSGKELHLVYYKDEQIGVNSNSRKYRFFGVGINDAEKTALKNMTYQYDDAFVFSGDLTGGSSDTYYYYNKKNNDCLVLTINKNSARVANMTYFTDFKKATATLD